MLLLVLLQAGSGPVRVTVSPSPVYIERSTWAQHLQFEFLVEGLTSDSLRLTAIRLTAMDSTGRPWQIRFVDESGSDPSILTVPRREIPGRSRVLVYNPFHTFPPDAPVHRLRYELSFVKGKEEWRVEATVAPTPYRQPFDLMLPLRGRLLVFEGHDFYSHHRRVDYLHPMLLKAGFAGNSGRYSHDLSIVDREGRMFRTDGKRNEDWYSWEAPVRAPQAGRVVSVENGMPDYDVGNPLAGLPLDSILARPATLFGNHVFIDHGGGRVSRLLHLKRGSVTVRPGRRVAEGQLVGRVGFSGSVYTVHLHYEVADGPGVQAEGLPAYFSRFKRVQGGRLVPVARGPIDTGDIVQP